MGASTRKRAALGAVVAALTLTGCGIGSAGSRPTDPPPSSRPPASAAAPSAPAAPQTGGDVQASDLPTAAEAPMAWDDAAQASAIATATTVVTDYIRKDLPPAAWWNALLPYLTVTAQADYAGTDQLNVPGTKVKRGAQAALGDRGAAYLAVVAVPTDGGPYTVQLERGPSVGTDASHWLASKITPPRGQ